VARAIQNFSLDPALCAEVKAQALLEDRSMSRIAAQALSQYLAEAKAAESREHEDA
jgi:hypothetical protein